MRQKEVIAPSRREIEAKLASVGDYVKMDYLQACLKKPLDFDTKRFALLKLSEVYESRNIYLEAAKLIRAAADINTTYDAKINDFTKSAELFIKAGVFDEADISLTKALGCASEIQKSGIKMKIKNAYKAQALILLKRDKRRMAMDAYEKLLSLDLSPQERKEAQQSLLFLYEKLGKVKEYMQLSKTI